MSDVSSLQQQLMAAQQALSLSQSGHHGHHHGSAGSGSETALINLVSEEQKSNASLQAIIAQQQTHISQCQSVIQNLSAQAPAQPQWGPPPQWVQQGYGYPPGSPYLGHAHPQPGSTQ